MNNLMLLTIIYLLYSNYKVAQNKEYKCMLDKLPILKGKVINIFNGFKLK